MNEPDMSNAYDQALSWLRWLYGDRPDGLIWIGGHANWRGMRFADPASAARYAIAIDHASAGIPAGGVYHRLTTMNDTAERRGEDSDSVSLPAVMLDLDLRGPGHVADTYPETLADLQLILSDAGLPEPSAWVESGGGRYPCWRLEKPLLLAFGEETFDLGQRLLREVQAAVRGAARGRGWKLDNTSDLARVYRMPGTTNRKNAPVMAVWRAGAHGVDAGGGYALADLSGLKPQFSGSTAPVGHPSATPQVADDDGGYAGGLAGLFGGRGGQGAQAAGGRGFTVAEAMAFVRPALDALASAADGEINVRLNDAACALAHFGPEFWDEAAADAQLEKALACTLYDGVTWKAADTIASARRAMAGDWRGVLVPAPHEAAAAGMAAAMEQPDAIEALLAEMLEPGEVISRPPPRYLIHGLLQFDSESWMIGPPGSKKSFVVLDMAAAVLTGGEWQGRRTNPADVVMIVAEGSGGLGKRLKAWEVRHGKMPTGMRILPRPVQAGQPQAWGVLVGACARLAASARERGRGMLIVLDTQARVTVGMKENDATDMGVFIGALSAIREHTGGCVLTVHHTGRAGGDARGSSAIDGAQTTELKVMPAGKLTARLTVEKQKDIEEIEPIRLAFEIVDVGVDEDGQRVTSLVLAGQDSAGFRAAWSGAEVTEEGVAAEEQAKVTPLKARTEVESWVASRDSRAAIQHWIVQALVDTAKTEGLTQSEVKGLVEEKREKPVDRATFKRAWQVVIEEGGAWSDVVVRSGGQRWTVDPVAIEGLRKAIQA